MAKDQDAPIQTPVDFKFPRIVEADGRAIATSSSLSIGEYIATCINDHARLQQENVELKNGVLVVHDGRIIELQQQVERLTKALEHYADEYCDCGHSDKRHTADKCWSLGCPCLTFHNTARQALQGEAGNEKASGDRS